MLGRLRSEAKHRTAAAVTAPTPAELRTATVTIADFTAFRQQLRWEMTDVVQQLKVEVSETVNDRMDMLNCINTALQNVSARSTASLPYAISDLIPRN